MISIICVYNDENIFRNWLLKSLENQTVECELVALDNSGGKFKSAAQAYNYGVRQIKKNSTYIMFVHQDIDLMSATWLESVEQLLDQMPGFGITGVAGMSENNERMLTKILHGTSPPMPAGDRVEESVALMTVDECLFIIPRKIFSIYPFDEQLCNGWHIYAVEYCLRMKTIQRGVYLLPVEVHHKSLGFIDKTYFKSLWKVLRHYRKQYKKINTTCGMWHTRTPLWYQVFNKKTYAFLKMLTDRGVVPGFLRRRSRERLWQYLKLFNK